MRLLKVPLSTSPLTTQGGETVNQDLGGEVWVWVRERGRRVMREGRNFFALLLFFFFFKHNHQQQMCNALEVRKIRRCL